MRKHHVIKPQHKLRLAADHFDFSTSFFLRPVQQCVIHFDFLFLGEGKKLIPR
jgi:hypothetical protein